jgi:hypothetical protein
MAPPAHDTLTPLMNRRPQLSIVAPGASPEEAAAVVAALEQFMRATAPAAAPAAPAVDPWQRAALHEVVLRDPQQQRFPWA